MRQVLVTVSPGSTRVPSGIVISATNSESAVQLPSVIDSSGASVGVSGSGVSVGVSAVGTSGVSGVGSVKNGGVFVASGAIRPGRLQASAARMTTVVKVNNLHRVFIFFSN